VCRKPEGYRGEGSLRAYLFGVARFVLIGWARRLQRARVRLRAAVEALVADPGLRDRGLRGLDSCMQSIRVQIAVKELLRTDPAAERRFTLEAAITARLQHPGIRGRGHSNDDPLACGHGSVARMSEPRTIVVTGGGRGLGRATAEKLARAGHHVVLTARDRARGEQALAQIRGAAPGCRVELRSLDLAALASVRAFAAQLLADGLVVDVLLHNAGVMQQSPTRRVTVDGFEETLATNTLAPFLLTRALLPALERSEAARVVCVSSMLHMPGSRGEPVRFDFDDPQVQREYHPDRAYKNSKLALLWWTYELQRRLPPRRITANAVCPGFVPVTAAQSVRGPMRWFMRHVLAHMPFARSVEQAASSLAWMATDPSLEGVGGKYFSDCVEQRSSEDSRDPALAARFWALACALVGVPEGL